MDPYDISCPRSCLPGVLGVLTAMAPSAGTICKLRSTETGQDLENRVLHHHHKGPDSHPWWEVRDESMSSKWDVDIRVKVYR